MLPTPSRPRCYGPSAFTRLAVAALLVASLAPVSQALDVTVIDVEPRGGDVWCTVRLDEVFPQRVEESLARGMPATLQLHAELWRKRTAWLDRLEDSFDAELRIQFDVWERQFRIERRGLPGMRVASLDSVRASLSRPLALRVGRRARLQPGGRYYVVVIATLKPLSVKDAAEIEGWLSGEVEEKSRSGLGGIAELPSSLFDAVRNFAGFGDIRSRTTSVQFLAPRDSTGR